MRRGGDIFGSSEPGSYALIYDTPSGRKRSPCAGIGGPGWKEEDPPNAVDLWMFFDLDQKTHLILKNIKDPQLFTQVLFAVPRFATEFILALDEEPIWMPIKIETAGKRP